MAKTVELRRHTESDGDVLTEDGVRAAVGIGSRLTVSYDLLISSGAQRATQTLACFLAGMGRAQPCGVTVDAAFRSAVEERWFVAARRSAGKDLEPSAGWILIWSRRRRWFSAVPSDRCSTRCPEMGVR